MLFGLDSFTAISISFHGNGNRIVLHSSPKAFINQSALAIDTSTKALIGVGCAKLSLVRYIISTTRKNFTNDHGRSGCRSGSNVPYAKIN